MPIACAYRDSPIVIIKRQFHGFWEIQNDTASIGHRENGISIINTIRLPHNISYALTFETLYKNHDYTERQLSFKKQQKNKMSNNVFTLLACVAHRRTLTAGLKAKIH